ncbi:MAG: methylase, partial [Bosea sp. (in: a-proteobacteria)]
MTPFTSAAALRPLDNLADASATDAPAGLSPDAKQPDTAKAIFSAAQELQHHLKRGQRVDATVLRAAMTKVFGASDADGAWDWKLAYEATEAATVLFLRQYGPALLNKAGSPEAMLQLLAKIVVLLPTQTRRSEDSNGFQQFSTPIELGWAAITAAAIQPGDVVLEPSAGTGLLAIFTELSRGQFHLNELAKTRADLLGHLFPTAPITRFDASQIDDHLAPSVRPSVVIMNPPFSV